GPGQGSEFIVRLPVLRDSEPAPGNGEAGESVRRRLPSESRRILVVDDNRDGADSLAHLLEILGHQVRRAYDGPQAVQAALEWRPELVLLDIGLPRPSGYVVARRRRAQP